MSETVLWVDNAKLGICYIYVCKNGIICPLNVHVCAFFYPKKKTFFRLDPNYYRIK